jgi:hypothetical protein
MLQKFNTSAKKQPILLDAYCDHFYGRSVTVKGLEREVECSRARKDYDLDRSIFSLPEPKTSEEAENIQVELPPRVGMSNILAEKLAREPRKKKDKQRSYRVTSCFIPGIALAAPKEITRSQHFLSAKERVFVRALEQTGFQLIPVFSASSNARVRDTYTWKLSIMASSAFEVVLVLDGNMVTI